MKRSLRIATRASRLARWQTDHIAARLRDLHPGLEIAIIEVTTTGDAIRDRSLAAIGTTGVFTKELEHLLLNGEADIAVHSLKDVETTLPDGLTLLALPEREDPRDALLCRATGTGGGASPGAGRDSDPPLAVLPPGACVGTSSIRRRAQLAAARPDLRFVDLRGNVPTRIEKLERGDSGMDAAILAHAGLERLGFLDRITADIELDVVLPAVGQGALAIEGRRDDAEVGDILRPLDNARVRVEVTAERAWLRRLHGGCQVPAGALARVVDGEVELRGVVCALDGTAVFRGEVRGAHADTERLGISLAESLLEQGAHEIVAEVEAMLRRAAESGDPS